MLVPDMFLLRLDVLCRQRCGSSNCGPEEMSWGHFKAPADVTAAALRGRPHIQTATHHGLRYPELPAEYCNLRKLLLICVWVSQGSCRLMLAEDREFWLDQ